MLGNSNLTMDSYTETENNNTNMIFVDIDNDPSTINSSSASLVLGNVSNSLCTEIVYAGLYWSGRSDSNARTYTVNKSNLQFATSTSNISLYHASPSNGAYSMNILRSGTTNAYFPIYQFNFEGTIVEFQFSNNNASSGSGIVSYRYGTTGTFNGISGTKPAASNNNSRFTFDVPFNISVNGRTYKINYLNRDSRTDRNLNNYRDNSFGYAQINALAVSSSNTKTLDKRTVKIKKEGGAYQTITANDTDILYPSGNYSDMYAGYADITEFVRLNNTGNYYVADLATQEGSNTPTGYYGGWGIVVVYANPTMKWRDISVFDGYAYVLGGTAEHNLPISGFESAQNGQVNVTLGFMSGEGDVGITGDYLRVLKRNSNVSIPTNWVNLGNTGNTGGAFYSNISTGGNTRSPNNLNNSGFDIQKFDLPNQVGGSNVIIGNSQTSTSFKYGSTGDTYIIYNMVFAVDAYVPEVEGVNQVLTASTTADINNLQPGDEVTYTLDVYNYGSDIIDNGKIDVDIPNAMKVVSYSIQQNTQAASGANQAFNFSQPQWVNPETNSATNIQPATIDGGIIRWTLGTIPTQSAVTNLNNRVPMAKLTYTLKVTDNCTVLQTSKDECALKPEINGTITGLGRNSGENLSTEFIKGYNADCNNTPIYGGIDMQINPSEAFLTQCSLDEPIQGETRIFRKFCQVANNEIIRNEITSQYIAGTKFYSMLPTDANATVLTGNFPVNPNGAQTMYYAVLPGANQACFYQLATQLDVINQAPSVSNVDVCYGVTYILNPIVPSFVVENAPSYYYFENGSTTPSIPFVQPIKPGVYTYQVALGKEENGVYCFGPKSSFTITIRNCQTPVNPMIYTPLNR